MEKEVKAPLVRLTCSSSHALDSRAMKTTFLPSLESAGSELTRDPVLSRTGLPVACPEESTFSVQIFELCSSDDRMTRPFWDAEASVIRMAQHQRLVGSGCPAPVGRQRQNRFV